MMVATIGALTGCASMYVDGTTKEVPAAQYKVPDAAKPVQFVFEFQTKGVANDRATAFLKDRVLDQVKSSRLFSSVSDKPVEGGALLSVTLNNVPLSDDAFTKGFVTGLTFGLAGSQVSDGYICTAKYSATPGGAAISKQARHAIHTTVGSAATPANATKAANAEEAVTLMTRQILSNVLNDLSKDKDFK
ncbi:MAG: hypothetical protein C4K60_04540 [Ideonella sp. MAG2]|nr:MAG: hypothetical protein C4K60_04540 [Ideonella sp. MAG2]